MELILTFLYWLYQYWLIRCVSQVVSVTWRVLPSTNCTFRFNSKDARIILFEYIYLVSVFQTLNMNWPETLEKGVKYI